MNNSDTRPRSNSKDTENQNDVPETTTSSANPTDGALTSDGRTFAMLTHLAAFSGPIIPFGNIVGPLIIWSIKKETSEFVNYHGKSVINYQISLTIYLVISFVLCFVLIGIPMVLGLVIWSLVTTIINAMKANNGEYCQYHLTIQFIK